MITKHLIYQRLGGNIEPRLPVYRQLFRWQLGKADVDAVREATNKAWILGDDRFRAKMGALSGRRTSQKPRGRHSKIAN